ncbi:hypothetical protein MTP03_01470 [Tsukamurella sp. PLM1]|nr:septum formation family protein [Tsukamurella sp. PLM1]BDH55208.1 hypothetical protein MTP03_01470 [Tsukamurella sp. PLM1]
MPDDNDTPDPSTPEPQAETPPEPEFDQESEPELDQEPELEPESEPEPEAPARFRGGAWAVRAVLAAVVVGAIAIGATLFATGAFEPKNEEKAPRLAAAGTILDRSKPGTCLTWDKDPTTLAPVDCMQPHKFEVAGEPARTFPAEAKYPTETALAAQRDQLCPPIVTEYLGKRLDPKGRFQTGLLTAGEKAWESGDRTMRCGVQVVDGAGAVQEVQGKVVNQDASLSWPPGTCIGIGDRGQATSPVDCAKPHAFEVTAVIDLRQAFPGASCPRWGSRRSTWPGSARHAPPDGSARRTACASPGCSCSGTSCRSRHGRRAHARRSASSHPRGTASRSPPSPVRRSLPACSSTVSRRSCRPSRARRGPRHPSPAASRARIPEAVPGVGLGRPGRRPA